MKTSFSPDTPYETHDDLPTLSELKAQAEAVQDLGAEIVELTDRQFRRVRLEGPLQAAILEARRLSHERGAKRRQLQFIGKLMRGVDTEPLRRALEDIRTGRPFVSPAAAQARAWTERLLLEGRPGIEAFLQEAPAADRTRLAQLVRQHGKVTKLGRDATAARQALSAYVTEHLAAAS
ncbi:MAG TPA: ribosome biogenesis factor YjgA [Myxococcota bacterium]|nr:ribosome biogenesis factor YjgA [Myxococcota bacterium]